MNFNLDEVQNGTVVDQNGDKIGSVGKIYLDDVTDQQTWVTVNTGLFGNKESFIPLNGANISGSEIRVPYTKDFIKDAPNVDEDGHIDESEEKQLYDYYSKDQGYNTREQEFAAGRGDRGDAAAAGTAATGTETGTTATTSTTRTTTTSSSTRRSCRKLPASWTSWTTTPRSSAPPVTARTAPTCT